MGLTRPSGLTGVFDGELRFTPEHIPPGAGGPLPGGIPAVDLNGPSIFTAVQEQFGLKLDAQRGPVEVRRCVADQLDRLGGLTILQSGVRTSRAPAA